MNQAINKALLEYFFIFAIPFILIKGLYIGSLIYLEKKSVEYKDIQSSNFYQKFKLSQSFNIEYKKAPIKPKKVEIKGEVLKLTDLKLKGVYISKESTFIAVEDKREVVFIDLNSEYKNYKLIDVELNRAIFKKSGKNYELKLNDKDLPTVKEVEVISNLPQSTPKSFAIERNTVDRFTKNFDEIWKNISIKEIREQNMIKGFKINSINPTSIFAKIGLKKSDIIKAVNGKKLKSYADAFKIYKKIKKIDSLKITILRDNQIKDLEYEIN